MTSFTKCNIIFIQQFFNNSVLHHTQEPHHHPRALQEVSNGICTRIHRKLLKIWARIAFSPEQFTISFNLFSAHNIKFQILFSLLLVTSCCKGVPDPGISCILLSEEHSTVELYPQAHLLCSLSFLELLWCYSVICFVVTVIVVTPSIVWMFSQCWLVFTLSFPWQTCQINSHRLVTSWVCCWSFKLVTSWVCCWSCSLLSFLVVINSRICTHPLLCLVACFYLVKFWFGLIILFVWISSVSSCFSECKVATLLNPCIAPLLEDLLALSLTIPWTQVYCSSTSSPKHLQREELHITIVVKDVGYQVVEGVCSGMHGALNPQCQSINNHKKVLHWHIYWGWIDRLPSNKKKSRGIATSEPWGGVITCYFTLGLHPKLKAEETVMCRIIDLWTG